ncbi:MAG: hypothetical protein NC095_10385 [Muribaculum sp.]|nr:hypothetical protein [Muribaculum sp.]
MTKTRAAILTFAENRESFRFIELFSYLNKLFEISKVTLSWYLREMVQKHILFKLGRGIYTSKSVAVKEYEPHLRSEVLNVGSKIKKAFPLLTASIFDGQILSDFQHHLSSNNAIYIEVDRDAVEAVFHFLKKEGYKVYLNPDKDFVYNNIDLNANVLIVKPLISESPLIEYNGVKTPKLEKILVDILCDEDLDYLGGIEWHYILENALERYSVNRTNILRYASRRNAQKKVADAIKEIES